jgi:Cof subfamily protein (haloacid dehalogenase superfamily)
MFPGEKPDIRLLAIDLDDTLLTGGLIITPRTKKAIQAACRQGVAVTLATGRMFTSALPYAQELGIGLPLITYQGALVRTPDGQTISHHPIDQRLCVELLSFLLPFECQVNVYIEDQFYIEKTSPEAERYRARIRTAYHEVPSLLAMMAESAMGATKIALMADKERISEIMAAIRAHFQERVLAVPSKPTFLEINRPDTGKGVALAAMAEGMGIGRLQVMAIGDSPNDLDMIEYAGWGIVMANGEDAVKEKARWVTASNEEEGVAVAIEHLVLK